jgi:hypothetical protein
MALKNLNWQEHTGNTKPVNLANAAMVVYRTEISSDRYLSHIHAPMQADKLNWQREDGKTKHAPKIGKIARYAVVRR